MNPMVQKRCEKAHGDKSKLSIFLQEGGANELNNCIKKMNLALMTKYGRRRFSRKFNKN